MENGAAEVLEKLKKILTEIAESEKSAGEDGEGSGIRKEKLKELSSFIEEKVGVSILGEYNSHLELLSFIISKSDVTPFDPLVIAVQHLIAADAGELSAWHAAVRSVRALLGKGKLESLDKAAWRLEEKIQRLFGGIERSREEYFRKMEEKYNTVLIKTADGKIDLPAGFMWRYGEINGLKLLLPVSIRNVLGTKQQADMLAAITAAGYYTIAKKVPEHIPSIFRRLYLSLRETVKGKPRNLQMLNVHDILNNDVFGDMVYLFENAFFLSKDEKNDGTKLPRGFLEPFLMDSVIKMGLISPKSVKKKKITGPSVRKSAAASLTEYFGKFAAHKIGMAYEAGAVPVGISLKSNNILKDLADFFTGAEREIESSVNSAEVPDEQKLDVFKNRVLILYDILNMFEDWLGTVSSSFGSDIRLLRKISSAVIKIREELDRRYENYGIYINSLIEQKVRESLDAEIDGAIKELEGILEEYERNSAAVIDRDLPQLNRLIDILENFGKKLGEIGDKVRKTFLRYNKEGKINVYPVVKRWEEKYAELRSKVRFAVSEVLTGLAERFRKILLKEKDIFADLAGELTGSEGAPVTLSLDVITAEKMSENELRERISELDKRIDELERIKKIYEKERDRFRKALEKIIMEREEIIPQKCVICHKEIDIVEDNFIRCGYCGRLMHYLCAAAWLEEHNSCPVCNNEFVIPVPFPLDEGEYDTDLSGVPDYYIPEEDSEEKESDGSNSSE